MSDTKDHPESIWKEIAEQLYSALQLCSAELFAQCAEMPRAARYIEMARNAQARFERAAASPKDAANLHSEERVDTSSGDSTQPLSREQHLKLAVDAVNERFEVAKALRQIALGECYSESALTKAMSMCLRQEQQVALVRRYLLGIEKSTDHVALQQLANEIEDRTGHQPDESANMDDFALLR